MCTHNGKCTVVAVFWPLWFPDVTFPDFIFPLEFKKALHPGFIFSQHQPFIWSGALSVFVWSYLCWFSLSSCCLRRVGRNLLLAKAASMSSISRLLKSRMAERMRRLSSRSTVPSSCDRKRQTCMWLKLSQQSRVANIWLAKISPVALIFASVSKHIADVQLYKNPQLQ